MKFSKKYAILDVSIPQLDALIMPIKVKDACKLKLDSLLVRQIGQFTRDLGRVHKYKDQSREFGSRVIPWKTCFETNSCNGKKILVTEDQLFQLRNFITTSKSQFGNLVRTINERSSDQWNARYFYDHGHSLTSINMPYRDVCFKYCHKFPRRLKTSCPGRGKCDAENACRCGTKCGGKKQCGKCKGPCVKTFCH